MGGGFHAPYCVRETQKTTAWEQGWPYGRMSEGGGGGHGRFTTMPGGTTCENMNGSVGLARVQSLTGKPRLVVATLRQ